MYDVSVGGLLIGVDKPACGGGVVWWWMRLPIGACYSLLAGGNTTRLHCFDVNSRVRIPALRHPILSSPFPLRPAHVPDDANHAMSQEGRDVV